MKIISWNINGLKSLKRKGNFEDIFGGDPDIVCFQEVKCKEEIPKVDGYHVYNNPSKEQGSGVAIFSKIKPIGHQNSMWPLRFNSEGRILTLKFSDFNLITFYAPSGASEADNLCFKYMFYDKFTQYIKKSDKPAIICGDFNRISQEIDARNPEEMRKKSGFLPQEEAWFKDILNTGYIDAFRYFHKDEVKFTWWPYSRNARKLNNGLRLDYFLVDKKLKCNLIDSDILECQEGSDHAPIVLELDLSKD